MDVPPSVHSVWGFVFDPKWAAVNDLNSVGSSTSLCSTPVGILNPLREAMTSQWSNLRVFIFDAFVNKFDCSKHDITMRMARGSEATERKCDDYSGNKVRSFSSRCGRHDTLWLLTVITKVLVECIIEPAIEELGPACVWDLNGAIKRKCRNWQNIMSYR